jgi:hypothetical protein
MSYTLCLRTLKKEAHFEKARGREPIKVLAARRVASYKPERVKQRSSSQCRRSAAINGAALAGGATRPRKICSGLTRRR